MISAGRSLPSEVTMPSRAKWSIPSVTNSTFGLVSVRNQSVVEQDAFAVGRIGRQAFLDQVGTVLQFGFDEVREFLAMPVVALVDGAVGMRPVRILAQEGQQAVAVAPEHVEAVPLHVKRQMREQPLRAFGDGIGIARDRTRPLRRTLVDGDRRHAVGDRRHELHRGRAGADDGDVLAVDLDVVGPQCRMEYRSGEVFFTLEMGARWVIQLADRADEHGGFEGFGRRLRSAGSKSSAACPHPTGMPSVAC